MLLVNTYFNARNIDFLVYAFAFYDTGNTHILCYIIYLGRHLSIVPIWFLLPIIPSNNIEKNTS